MCDVYLYHSQKLLCLRWFNTCPATAATFFRFVVSHQSLRITSAVSMQPRTMEYHNTTAQVDNLTQRTIVLRTLLFALILKSYPSLFSLPQFQTSFVLVSVQYPPGAPLFLFSTIMWCFGVLLEQTVCEILISNDTRQLTKSLSSLSRNTCGLYKINKIDKLTVLGRL